MTSHHTLRASLCPLILCLLSAQVKAQTSSTPVLAHPRVRLVDVTSGRPQVTGVLTGRVGDTLFIMADSTEAEPQRFTVTSSHRIEHSVGMQRRTLEGFGSGLVLGAMAGVLIGLTTYESCEESDDPCLDFGRGFSVGVGAVVLAVPSAIIGAIAGHKTRREGWVSGSESRTRISVAPLQRGGLRVGAAVAF